MSKNYESRLKKLEACKDNDDFGLDIKIDLNDNLNPIYRYFLTKDGEKIEITEGQFHKISAKSCHNIRVCNILIIGDDDEHMQYGN